MVTNDFLENGGGGKRGVNLETKLDGVVRVSGKYMERFLSPYEFSQVWKQILHGRSFRVEEIASFHASIH